MMNDEAIPAIADLWTALQAQASRIAELEGKARQADELRAANDRLAAELERQRLEKVTLQSEVAELEGARPPGEKKFSRAGLLKAAAAGAAGLAGAGMLGGGVAQAGNVTPGNVYDGDVILGGSNAPAATTSLQAANGASGTPQFVSGDPVLWVGPANFGTGTNQLIPSANLEGIRGTGCGYSAGVTGYGGKQLTQVGYGNGVQGFSGSAFELRGYDFGVAGASGSGVGVCGQSEQSHGVKGTSNSGAGGRAGVYGCNYAGTSTLGVEYGVIGKTWTDSSETTLGDGVGVLGATRGGFGVQGTATDGLGGTFQGGRAPIHLEPTPFAGAPTTGGHAVGDIVIDEVGTLYECVSAGTPGTFVPLMHGNSNDGTADTLFTAVSTQQYTLSNSDGVTWTDMDGAHLALSITPAQKSLAIISGNSDLWTSQAGYNQDLGIFLSGGGYPTTAGQPEAWKESGGFAGTFSPNAAFVQTVLPLLAGVTYTVKLQWKANKSATGATIWAGAGPIGGKFSPTRLTVLLIPTP